MGNDILACKYNKNILAMNTSFGYKLKKIFYGIKKGNTIARCIK